MLLSINIVKDLREGYEEGDFALDQCSEWEGNPNSQKMILFHYWLYSLMILVIFLFVYVWFNG